MTDTTTTTIATHNGVFHADDVFAVAVLRHRYRYNNIKIIRTRDEDELDKADYVVDVGGIYDGTFFFDHHQRGFDLSRDGVPYAAAGLVWKTHGVNICAGDKDAAREIDRRLFQAIDASDNGQALFEGGTPVFEYARQTSLSRVISLLNPAWNVEGDADEAFAIAERFAGEILRSVIEEVLADGDARRLVEEAESLRHEREDHVLVFNEYVPWTGHVDVLHADAYFAIFPGSSGGWMVQCIPPQQGSFEQRVPMPEEWAGLRSTEFQDASGISDGIFCHPGRFIAGADSKESAIELAEIALVRFRTAAFNAAAKKLAQ